MTTPQTSYIQDIIEHLDLAEAEKRTFDHDTSVAWPGTAVSPVGGASER
jgi:hypothetical protein